jgi:hypothetical protein
MYLGITGTVASLLNYLMWGGDNSQRCSLFSYHRCTQYLLKVVSRILMIIRIEWADK